jgi:hypothetical protein
MADYALIIGGKRVDTEKTVDVLNPADGTVVKSSGIGVEFNVDGLKEYTTIQVPSVAL